MGNTGIDFDTDRQPETALTLGSATLPTYRPVIACIGPACNEARTIEAVLRSLLKQNRLPDEIRAVVKVGALNYGFAQSGYQV